ncbi:MAG: hypothetical protein EOP36_18110 [Rubrivivax sp.]|nr:MAG: hypothetical protein EOP36_18110 [Rubrivivax sp.]
MQKPEKVRNRFRAVAGRVASEVAALAAVGAAWAWFRMPNHAAWTVGDGVEDGFKAFFFAGYFYSYFMRATKSADDKLRHGDLAKKQEALLAELNAATERLIGHSSGGNSVGWLMLVNPHDGGFHDISAHVHGEYPLIDATASVLDLDRNDQIIEELRRTNDYRSAFRHHVNFRLGTLQPDLAFMQKQVVPCDTTKPLLRFTVDWVARNGKWTQFVQVKRSGERWDFATAVQRDEEWVFENPPRDQLPRRSDGSPDVFWLAESYRQVRKPGAST